MTVSLVVEPLNKMRLTTHHELPTAGLAEKEGLERALLRCPKAATRLRHGRF